MIWSDSRERHFRPTRATVDLDALAANVIYLKKLVDPGFFCPMVKANAYGHGDIEVARTIFQIGAARVGVVSIEEALALRRGGIDGEILVFGRLTKESAAMVFEYRLTPVLSDWQDFQVLLNANSTFSLSLHVKLDTGMHRMGFPLADVERLCDFFDREKRLVCAGLCTHLSLGADAANPNGRTEAQISKFRQAYSQMDDAQMYRHVLNSDALLAMADLPKERAWLGARPGLALYGLIDSPGLRPVMSLESKLDLVRRVKPGESVSYGGRWTASRESWIGVVPVGYGDGYWRSFSNKGYMLFRGVRVPVVGTVCMDYSLLDLTETTKSQSPQAGEEVVVFGRQGQAQITVWEMTDQVGSIPYELVTLLSGRVPRLYGPKE